MGKIYSTLKDVPILSVVPHTYNSNNLKAELGWQQFQSQLGFNREVKRRHFIKSKQEKKTKQIFFLDGIGNCGKCIQRNGWTF